MALLSYGFLPSAHNYQHWKITTLGAVIWLPVFVRAKRKHCATLRSIRFFAILTT